MFLIHITEHLDSVTTCSLTIAAQGTKHAYSGIHEKIVSLKPQASSSLVTIRTYTRIHMGAAGGWMSSERKKNCE